MRIPHHRSGHSESDKKEMDMSEGNAALKVSTRYEYKINLGFYAYGLTGVISV